MADRTFSKPEATLSTDALSASSFIQLARVMARTSIARKASTADDQRCHQVCIVASSGRAGLGGSIVYRDAAQAPSNPYCSPCRRLVGVHTGQLQRPRRPGGRPDASDPVIHGTNATEGGMAGPAVPS